VTTVLEKILGIKLGLKPDPGPAAKGAAPAWLVEYQNIAKLIDKGDDDIKKALEMRFQTVNKDEIKKILQRDNSEIYKLEKKLRDDLHANYEQRGKDEAEQLVLRGESAQLEIEQRKKDLEDLMKIEQAARELLLRDTTDYDAKIKELESDKKKTKKETMAEEITSMEEQIRKIRKVRQQLENERMIAQSDDATPEQRRNLEAEAQAQAAREYELRKSWKEKTVALEQEKTRQLREEMKKVGDDVKRYGEQLINAGAGAMWDAMTISNAALKESAMTRGEMIMKALKTELEGIAKSAAVQSVYQGAMSLASYAIGDVKGGTAHAASAAAYAAVAGVAYLGSRGISAPSDAEIQRRKDAMKGDSSSLSNSRAGVSGARAEAPKVYNYYFPSGLILGTADDVVRQFQRAQDEADRRGVA
jgi:hypothetical protein